MTAEQWLAELEAKAKNATHGKRYLVETDDDRCMNAVYVATKPDDAEPGAAPENVIAITLLQSPPVASIADGKWDENAALIVATDPAAVLRLVSMVREYDAEATRYKKALEWALINRLYIYPDCGGKKCFRKKGESCTLSYVECMTRRILEGSASGERPMMDAARGAEKLLREAEQRAK